MTNMVSNIEIPKKGFTHSGKFHADDVFSAALLTYLNPEIKIIRGNEVPEGFDGIVFDIGGGEFDHHQSDHRFREDDTPYAAFGLLWEAFGASIVGEEEAKRFESDFVQPLDISDNTGSPNMLANVISYFNPTWDSQCSHDEAFEEAKQFALTILRKKFELIDSIYRAQDMVTEALTKMEEDILVLPISAPWKKFVKGTTTEFVVFPSNRGGYCAQAVPAEKDEEEEERGLKVDFPKEWAGLRDKELEEKSGIKGLRFCHNSRFLIAAETLEGAILACKAAKDSKELEMQDGEKQ